MKKTIAILMMLAVWCAGSGLADAAHKGIHRHHTAAENDSCQITITLHAAMHAGDVVVAPIVVERLPWATEQSPHIIHVAALPLIHTSRGPPGC